MTTEHPSDPPIAEALAFIAENPRVFLLARRADGFPTGYPMLSRVREGAVDFSTYRASAKVRNLLRDGVAGVLCVSGAADDPRVVVAEGPVHLLEAGRTLEDDPRADAGLAKAPAVAPELAATVRERHASGKRCVLRVTIESARFARRPD